MPLRRLTGSERSPHANRQLAALLAFTAGAVDVAGFLDLRQFTSHMSGSMATIAAELETRGLRVVWPPALVLAAFVFGAACCAVVVNWSRRRGRESLYATPLFAEALLLCAAALLHHPWAVLAVLSFSMGLQNATISKISHAEIRTTHITGMVTDVGIEIGRALYWNRSSGAGPVHADRERLGLLLALTGLFFCGGVSGALAFPHIGMRLLMPLAALLFVFTFLPIVSDMRPRTQQEPS